MRRALAIVLLLLVAAVISLSLASYITSRHHWRSIAIDPGPPSMRAGTYEVELRVDGRDRRYLVHVPPSMDGRPVPLVLVLHGSGTSGDVMDYLTGMTAVADRQRFLVAFPDSERDGWNDGRQGDKSIDDVGFLKTVVEDIGRVLPVDAARVYSTGISNGALMSTRLACEWDGVAAIAPVSGTGPVDFESVCLPGRPVPIVTFLNTSDPFVPFGGGGIKLPLISKKPFPVVSAQDFVGFWVENNGCDARPTHVDLPNSNPNDNSRVERETYTGCDAGADVVFYKIDGAGHTWPGGAQYASPWVVGTTNRDIDATEIIWRFFADHPLAAAADDR